jgi:Carboxypeptidase regulatory-like domain
MRLLLPLLIALPLDAAILRGFVVENATSKALARALVALQPLPGTNGPTLSVRTNSYGIFEFINIPAGAYLVNGSRRGFFPVHYGQKRWNGAGAPIVLAQDQDLTISLRLPRYGGITGFVVDENDVGIPEYEVMAYRNTHPPKIVAKFPTDDRGWFRIWGLEPGNYLVRTAAKSYEDGGYLPTFFRDTLRVDEALTIPIALDQDTPDLRVRPFPGHLMTISGAFRPCSNPPPPVTVTLVSDMGRETTNGYSFSFSSRPPGNYEIFADSPGDGRSERTICGAYLPLTLYNRDVSVDGAMLPLPRLSFTFEGVPALDPASVRILARRKDLAGESDPQTLRASDNRTFLNRGRWELQLLPSPSYVAADFRGPRGERPEGGRADGWNEILVQDNGAVKYVLSGKPGGIHGVVIGPGHEPAAGAPVLLEAYDPGTRKRIHDLRTFRADMQGRYQIYGLAPGTYRVVSTFDLEAPDVDEIEALSPRTIRVEEGRDHQLDLDLASAQ